MADRSSDPNYRRSALVGATTWAGGLLVATTFGVLGVFSIPTYLSGGPGLAVLVSVVVYNDLHALPYSLGPAILAPVAVLATGGYYLAKTEPGGERAGVVDGAGVAVGYVGAVVLSEVLLVSVSSFWYPLLSVDPAGSAVRIVAVAVVAVVVGGAGGAVCGRQDDAGRVGTGRSVERSPGPDPGNARVVPRTGDGERDPERERDPDEVPVTNREERANRR